MGSVLGETIRKGTRVLKEPEWALLGTKMSSKCIRRLILPYAQVAQAVLRNAHPRLRLKWQLLTPKH
jgi:hypothetical protein